MRTGYSVACCESAAGSAAAREGVAPRGPTTTTVADTEMRAGFATPSSAPMTGAGLQEFRVLLRKNATGGSDPTYDIELWETGGGSAGDAGQRRDADLRHRRGRSLSVLPTNVVRSNLTRRDARTRDAARPGSADPRLGPRSRAVTVTAGRPEPTVRAPGAVARGCSARRTPAAPIAGGCVRTQTTGPLLPSR